MPKKNCYRATIETPSGNGFLMPFTALTKQASYEWHGDTLLNLVFKAVKTLWNMTEAYYPVVRVNGVKEGCTILGDAVTNNVELIGGVIYVAGAEITISSDTTIALTRPAASKYAVVALAAGSDGVVDVIKGTDGDALDLTGGYGGAGQKPYVAVDHVCLGYISLYGDTAAVVAQEDIYAGDNANVSFEIDEIRGLVVLGSELALNHTGGVHRGVYAQYYTQEDVLIPIGELIKAELEVTVDTVETTTLSSDWKDYEETTRGWKLSYEKFKENEYFFQKVMTRGSSKFFVKIREKRSDTFYRIGKALATSIKAVIERGPMKENVPMVGCGELVEVAA